MNDAGAASKRALFSLMPIVLVGWLAAAGVAQAACEVAGELLRCAHAGHEPLDLACRAPSCADAEQLEAEVRLAEARGVRVTLSAGEGSSGVSKELVVQWRRLGAAGEASERIATRPFSDFEADPSMAGPAAALVPVARHEDRLLRVVGAGLAPRTLFLAAGEDAAEIPTIQLPPARAGGEILAFVESPGYFPESLRVRGEAAAHPADAYGFWSASGLEPGSYGIEAVFAGGVVVAGPRVEVAAGQTTELIPWRLPASGALEILVESEHCADLASGEVAGRYQIEGPDGRRHGAELRRCVARFEGLAPGDWTISILDPAGESVLRAAARVEAGELSSLELADAGPSLVGRISIAEDRPLAASVVEILEIEGTDVEVDESTVTLGSTVTDADGRYALRLPAPGVYRLVLRGEAGFPILDREVTVEAGENSLDLDLGDAALWLRLVRADGGAFEDDVTVELRRQGDPFVLRTGRLAAGHSETLLYDLTFERYEVSAFTASGWTSLERPRVELSKSAPVAEVELILDRQDARLTVLGPDGRALDGARVAVDQRQVFEEAGTPGRFSLVGAAAGSELRIVPPPGYVPVCRVLRGESLEIRLREADAEAVLVPPKERVPSAGSVIGMLEGLPESDCAFPVSLTWEPFEDELGRPRIRIFGLTAGTFLFRHAGGEVVLQVPGPVVSLASSR